MSLENPFVLFLQDLKIPTRNDVTIISFYFAQCFHGIRLSALGFAAIKLTELDVNRCTERIVHIVGLNTVCCTVHQRSKRLHKRNTRGYLLRSKSFSRLSSPYYEYSSEEDVEYL